MNSIEDEEKDENTLIATQKYDNFIVEHHIGIKMIKFRRKRKPKSYSGDGSEYDDKVYFTHINKRNMLSGRYPWRKKKNRYRRAIKPFVYVKNLPRSPLKLEVTFEDHGYANIRLKKGSRLLGSLNMRVDTTSPILYIINDKLSKFGKSNDYRAGIFSEYVGSAINYTIDNITNKDKIHAMTMDDPINIALHSMIKNN